MLQNQGKLYFTIQLKFPMHFTNRLHQKNLFLL